MAPSTADGSVVALVDQLEVSAARAATPAFADLLRDNLRLADPTRPIPSGEAQEIVEQQYDACLEFVFSHPFWSSLRGGEPAAINAYLLETRHYLAAAPFRMAPAIPASPVEHPLTRLLAEHVVEEAGHDAFFENALAATALPRDAIRAARPLPATVEWITLMRTVAEYDPLCASLCSGLLESSARDREAVRGWHDMLTEKQLLDSDAVAAIFEHVSTDIGLGHGAKWRDALDVEGAIDPKRLALCLNAITLVAEMIHRWLTSLFEGVGEEIVAVARSQSQATLAQPSTIVWSAPVLDHVAHGGLTTPEGRKAVAGAWAFGGCATEASSSVNALVGDHMDVDVTAQPTSKSLRALCDGWMRAIDGHRLWSEMSEAASGVLVRGWLLENFHYIAAIAQHTGAAIASCTDPQVRSMLVHHLEEELDHGKLLEEALNAEGFPRARWLRPLPTTALFIGALRDLAKRDWRGYCLALSYLQLSLYTDGSAHRHDAFYDTILAKSPDSMPLVTAMIAHDSEDTNLDHGDDVVELLETLCAGGHVTASAINEASVIPQLCWSFLDGIAEHYRHGDAAVVARLGWHA